MQELACQTADDKIEFPVNKKVLLKENIFFLQKKTLLMAATGKGRQSKEHKANTNNNDS